MTKPYKCRVEYLESTGTQYIDLGFVVDSNKKVALGFSTASNQESKVPVGVYNGIFWTYIVYTYGANGLVTFNNSTVNTLGTFNTNRHDVSVDYKNLTYTYDGVSNALSGTPRDYTLNLILFGRNNNGTPDAFFNGLKVYYLRAYDNDVLIRDFIPVLDNSDVPAMYDQVSGQLFYNQGTGQFKFGPYQAENSNKKLLRKKLALMLANLKKKRPFYTEVEYIESSGTQYIDTGLIGTSLYNTNVVFSFSNITGSQCVYGALSSSDRNFLNFPFNEAQKTLLGYGSGASYNYYSYTPQVDDIINISIDFNNLTTVITSKNNNNLSGTITNSLTNTKPSLNLYLFSMNNGGTSAYQSKIKIYHATFYNLNGTLVRDFIPVLDWDYVPCLYDKVSGQLFYNQGTGDFSYGREIHKVDYIESDGNQYIDTKFIPTGNTGIDMRFLITGRGSGGNDSNMIMVGGDSAGYRCGFGYRSSSDTTYGHTLQVSGICATGNSWENYAMSMGAVHTILYNYDNQKKCYLDGVLKRENIPYGTATVTYPMFIFSSNMNGTSWRTSSFKLYYCKIIDNGVLVRDYLPAIDENGVGFLFDKVTHTIYDNAGTGVFKYPVRETEYTANAATRAYIDLGVKYKPSMSIEGKYTRDTYGNQGSVILVTTTTSAPLIYMPALSGTNTERFVWRRGGYTEQNYFISNIQYPFTAEIKIDAVNDTLTINNELVKTGMIAGMNGYDSPYESDSNMYMFSITSTYAGDGKVYYLKITDGTTPLFDLIPAYKDGEAGFYNKVNGTFYKNASTDSTAKLTGGKIIEPEYE